MATVNHLGPRTFPLPHAHAPHHEWLHQFTPEQRKQLVGEDLQARTAIATVLGAVMGFGLVGLVGLLIQFGAR